MSAGEALIFVLTFVIWGCAWAFVINWYVTRTFRATVRRLQAEKAELVRQREVILKEVEALVAAYGKAGGSES